VKGTELRRLSEKVSSPWGKSSILVVRQNAGSNRYCSADHFARDVPAAWRS